MPHVRYAAPLALALLMSLPSLQGEAAPARGPFAKMAGSWAGSGAITLADGRQEHLRCRADYVVGGGGSEMRLELRCASPSYNFNLNGDVESDGRRIFGSWSETSHNARGTVAGRVSGDGIRVVARGANFSAGLSVLTRGQRQSVAIEPQGESRIRAVDITLARRGVGTTGEGR